ncbi:MAG: hypothetical protein AAF092_05435 [Pseudomonadota bacterium]
MTHLQITPTRPSRAADATKAAGAALIGAGLSLLAAVAFQVTDLPGPPDGAPNGDPLSQDAATALHLQSLGKWR